MKFLRNRRINMNKFIGCLVLYALTTMSAFAQSSTNSPYSQFGLGDLADEGVGFNKGMGGVGYGFRKGNEVNPLNPASYSAIYSVTMIFDGGLSVQITNFKEGGRKLNAKRGGFDYIMGAPPVVFNLTLADVNGDGTVNVADLVKVIQIVKEHTIAE